ncbi:DUF6194 family protein [Saccharomonospora azurea]|uniref:DUF6194 domain-containing protein n=1 Tax=Saccharomonospora azurea NA-128 TaxID=882081 RepID=H8GAD0_9PSEU|nr:DUF6194 family protein [Saccharomonospora azurea]EHK84505.1 hypothetical protein SZMC14600_17689 [Saccharomonospora azurea SZMC 14600]EHY89627.1 hypothetical protein SacazDRAFT_02735 [Saccharomonospora azurea NA-128]
MDVEDVVRHIVESYEGVHSVEHGGDWFFFYGPDGDVDMTRTFPFATVVTGDHGETVSNLAADGAYRLNLGLTKASYVERFGPPPTERDDAGVLRTGADYAARDRLVPNPFYASQYWVGVVNPSRRTFDDEVRPLLDEAYGFAVRKHDNRAARAER